MIPQTKFSRADQYKFINLDYCFDEEYVVNIKSVLPSESEELSFVVGPTGAKIQKNCIFSIKDNDYFIHPANSNLRFVKEGMTFKPITDLTNGIYREDQEYGIVNFLNSNNYYHFIANDFPRILICYQAGFKKIGVLGTNLFDISKRNDFQKEILERLTDLELIPLRQLDNKFIGKACIPILPDEYGGEDKFLKGVHIYDFYTHRLTRYVIREIPKLFEITRRNNSRRIKIQRACHKNREPENSIELNNYLEKEWGFEICSFEKMSVHDQLQIVSDSEIVIGAHGSGLVNFIAAQQNSCLIEYGAPAFYQSLPNYSGSERTRTKNFYHHMCALKNCRYNYLPIISGEINISELESRLKSNLNK